MTDNGVYRRYVDKKFSEDTMVTITNANKLIAEYQRQGFSLTLRQLYYQFVARGLLENSQASYNRLGGIISDGRLAGLISWTAIEDRTRNLMGHQTFDGPGQSIKQAIDGYRVDRWATQPVRAEVWVEKEALTGVISGICSNLGVDFFACKGYNSQSEQWRAGRRFANYLMKGQRPIVFHLGDHDPSGLDMTRDNMERLSLFAGTPIQVIRLALNMPQIEQYGPPPNPTKFSDSRAEAYVREYGDSSWELDALSPAVISNLIETAILKVRNEKLWAEAMAQEAEDKRAMTDAMEMLTYSDTSRAPPDFE